MPCSTGRSLFQPTVQNVTIRVLFKSSRSSRPRFQCTSFQTSSSCLLAALPHARAHKQARHAVADFSQEARRRGRSRSRGPLGGKRHACLHGAAKERLKSIEGRGRTEGWRCFSKARLCHDPYHMMDPPHPDLRPRSRHPSHLAGHDVQALHSTGAAHVRQPLLFCQKLVPQVRRQRVISLPADSVDG